MALRYAIANYLSDAVDIYTSSEHEIYVKENLYNKRPSKPFRFEGIGTSSGASPEWICVDLLEEKRPNFTAIFNTNLTLGQSGDEYSLQACDEGCPGQSGGSCDWDLTPGSGGPAFTADLSDRLVDDHKNNYKTFNPGADYEFWRWTFLDAGNANNYIEIGELFLGVASTFQKAFLQPRRAEGPEFFEATNITQYGQIWSAYLSECEAFSLEIKNIGDPRQVNELKLFLQQVKRANGKFIIIPDDRLNFCYYVYLRNMSDFGQQIVKSSLNYKEHYSWRLDLRTLTEGIALLI